MNNWIKICAYIILCFCFGICNAQTYYYVLKRKVVNGDSSTNVSGGQFISFTKDGCYESDKEGFTVNNGSLKYKYAENGILVYSGTCYWGNGSFRFTTDKSKLNVVTSNGDIYVYSLAAAPANQKTCSLIRKPSSNGGASAVVPAYPNSVYNPIVTNPNVVNPEQQNSQSQRTPSKRWRNVRRVIDCDRCHHSGKCQTCNGKGWYQGVYGPIDCPNCDGYKTGRCSKCHGSGSVEIIEQVFE